MACVLLDARPASFCRMMSRAGSAERLTRVAVLPTYPLPHRLPIGKESGAGRSDRILFLSPSFPNTRAMTSARALDSKQCAPAFQCHIPHLSCRAPCWRARREDGVRCASRARNAPLPPPCPRAASERPPCPVALPLIICYFDDSSASPARLAWLPPNELND